MSDLALARNCSMARMLIRRSRVGVEMNRSARGGKGVKRFERSNGLDTALCLYKNYLYLFLPLPTCLLWLVVCDLITFCGIT